MGEELKSCGMDSEVCDIFVEVVLRDTGPSSMEILGYRARCSECSEEGPICEGEQQAITAWNTRAGGKA